MLSFSVSSSVKLDIGRIFCEKFIIVFVNWGQILRLRKICSFLFMVMIDTDVFRSATCTRSLIQVFVWVITLRFLNIPKILSGLSMCHL